MSTTDIDDRIDTDSSADGDSEHETATRATAPPEAVDSRRRDGGRRLSISLRGALVGLLVTVLVAAVGVLAWLYIGSQRKLDAEARAVQNRTHAEEVAIDYAVNAAQMDYQDFNGWKVKLVNGTSPELKDKLTKAADSMEQILAPLQWKSSARPLAAKVRSDAGGVYVVDSFVSVLTKTVQAPQGLQSTATYSVTLDSNKNWEITDVGGIDSALGK